MTEVLVAVLAFVGAALGAGLAYLATRAATRQADTQGRREEWGRRFTAALEAFTSSDQRRAEVGRAMLLDLFQSSLASEDDRRIAVAVLAADAAHLADGTDVRSTGHVETTRVIGDNDLDVEGNER